jgi:hypothetical protein
VGARVRRWYEDRTYLRFPGQLPDQSTTALFVDLAPEDDDAGAAVQAEVRIALPAEPAGIVFARNATVTLAVAEDPRATLLRPTAVGPPWSLALELRSLDDAVVSARARVPVPPTLLARLWKLGPDLATPQLTLATAELPLASLLGALGDAEVAQLRVLVLVLGPADDSSASWAASTVVLDDIGLYPRPPPLQSR